MIPSTFCLCTYGENFAAALAASITTDQEFLDLGLPENQLMLAYGIIASPDRIQGATGPRRTELALMLWKSSGSFLFTQGFSPDQASIMNAWHSMFNFYNSQEGDRAHSMAHRLQEDMLTLGNYFSKL